MKEQEHNRPGAWSSEPKQVDYEQLKARTIIALDKLGHQKFSPEPGGYSLENWMKGVNLLLDDFEEKMGESKLPRGYVEKKRLMFDYLLKPVDTSSIDGSISELKQKEVEVVRRLHEERTRTASKIDELQNELAKRSAELEEEEALPVDTVTPERPKSFFSRLLGRTHTSSAKASQDKFGESDPRLQSLPGEISEQRRLLKSIDQRSPTSPLAEEWKTLESLQARIKELESERLEKIQLVKEREEVTASMAEMISRIPPGEGVATSG